MHGGELSYCAGKLVLTGQTFYLYCGLELTPICLFTNEFFIIWTIFDNMELTPLSLLNKSGLFIYEMTTLYNFWILCSEGVTNGNEKKTVIFRILRSEKQGA